MTEWSIELNGRLVKQFNLADGQSLTIGRGSDADIILENTAISRRHLAISCRNDCCMVSDLGSKNGTSLNGYPLASPTAVNDRDIIGFGKFSLRLSTGNTSTVSRVSSVSSPMDIDEETIFVSTPKKNKQTVTYANDAPKRSLLVISGPASPDTLSLSGRSSIKIGTDRSCDMVLTGWFIGKAQCYIITREGKHWLVPQKSWAGTYVNGRRARQEMLLRKGDILKIRSITIRFDD